MRNGFDPETQYAALGERVEGQGRRLTNLENTVAQGFRQVETSIASLSNEFRSSQRPQWQAMSVILAFALTVGGLAYWPIRESTNDLKDAVTSLAEKTVTQKEMEWRTARGMEDRQRTERAIQDLRDDSVTRSEWSERNRARDQEISDLSRRVDEVRQNVGAVYGTRDVIVELKQEVEALRSRIAEGRPAYTAP